MAVRRLVARFDPVGLAVMEVRRKRGVLHRSWTSLDVRADELRLDLTLMTGQSFRWKQTGDAEYTGVIGSLLVSLRQTEGHVLFRLHPPAQTRVAVDERDAEVMLRDYLNLGTCLREVWTGFEAADDRFAAVAPYLLGARLLRQDPLECLFQFICSSNNHIPRITGMVDHLASLGMYLGTVNGFRFHEFPSIHQLASVQESAFRGAGFGYRAKFVVGTAQALLLKNGGREWLCSLRDVPLQEAVAALCTLPGVGPKVAACIALFSLDQHHAIPVDTHVWQIAVRYLTPELAGERLTPKLHLDVANAFVKRFGKYAGWAQTVLFISELSSHQNLLPPQLRVARSPRANKLKRKGNLLEQE